jgi:hypothetical protein
MYNLRKKESIMTMNNNNTMSKRQQKYVDAIVATLGGGQSTYTRAELRTVSESHGWKWIPNWITHDDARRAGRGVFHIPEAMTMPPADEQVVDDAQSLTAEEESVTMTA